MDLQKNIFSLLKEDFVTTNSSNPFWSFLSNRRIAFSRYPSPWKISKWSLILLFFLNNNLGFIKNLSLACFKILLSLLLVSVDIIFFDNKGSILKFDKNSKLIWKKNYYTKSEKKLKPILQFANDDNTVIVTDNIAKTRKDCLAFLSPQMGDVVNNAGSEVTAMKATKALLTPTSYAVMDGNWKYMYDRYNDVYRWVPLNGDVAGLCVETDNTTDPWYSPAGFNRGQVKNAVKLAFNPTKANRDDMYSAGINPVINSTGNGIVLFGDKTMVAAPTAFNRINVRRVFIVLEKAIAIAAKYQLFEFNDSFTRAQFTSLLTPFLRDVQGRRGIYDFKVICNTSNNTPQVIDSNEFVADIFIKPAKSINFIQLNFIATRTGVSFDEIGG